MASLLSAASLVVSKSTSFSTTYVMFNSWSSSRKAASRFIPLRLLVTGVSAAMPASSMAFVSSWISILWYFFKWSIRSTRGVSLHWISVGELRAAEDILLRGRGLGNADDRGRVAAFGCGRLDLAQPLEETDDLLVHRLGLGEDEDLGVSHRLVRNGTRSAHGVPGGGPDG